MNNRREFVKTIGLSAFGFSFFSSLSNANDFIFSPLALPRSAPEQEGISSEVILKLLEAIEKSNIEFHSLMIVRHGKVIAEGWWHPYQADYKHTLYSLSKSFTATAIGFAVAEKKLSLKDPVISFFPNDLPTNVSENLKKMTVKHLLTMSTGHTIDTTETLIRSADGNWPKAFLSIEVPKVPGTHFLYNTGATYMLSAILQKVTGKTLLEFLQPRLFQPLGIEGMDWENDPQGINVGGYGLRVKTEDIAKLGLLYLQNGRWQGKQILPKSWVEEAQKAQVMTKTETNQDGDWAQGYGYQFWRCKPGFYRGDGAFGQYCIIIPEQNTVIAITSESFDMQKSMTVLWENFLPALKNDNPLTLKQEKYLKVKSSLQELGIKPIRINVSSPIIEKINNKKFILEANEWGCQSISFSFAYYFSQPTKIIPKNKEFFNVNLETEKGNFSIQCDTENWVSGKNERENPDTLFPVYGVLGRTAIATKIATWATWKDEQTLLMRWQYVENAHHDLITCVFEGNQVIISFQSSINVANRKSDARKSLKGVIA
jgi:CubicO group peptidase (beta-lactamase class C family)